MKQKRKTGWFARLKQGLRKTQVNLVGIFTGGVVDEAFLEDLEFQMISADIGVETSALILERLRERIKLKGLKTQDEVKVALKEICRLCGPVRHPLILTSKSRLSS